MKKFKTFGGRLFALLFVFGMIFNSSQTYAASNAWEQWQSVITEDQVTEDNLLKSLKNTFSVELWHYSGGYWGNQFVRISDTQVFDDADQLAEAVNAVMEFEMP